MMKALNLYLEEYLDYCQYRKHLDPKTLKAYRIDLTQYERSMDNALTFYEREPVDAYITMLHRKYQPKTAKRKVASLKAFFRYLSYREILSENPFDKLDIRFREARLLPKTIPFHSVQALLSEAYRQRKTAHTQYQKRCRIRDIAVLELLFATGMRICELCSLKPQHIDLKEKTVRIYGKGAKERILQIGNPAVLSALASYQNAFAPEISSAGCFFVNRRKKQLSDQSVRFMIRHYARLAGIEQHITPHMFRHSFATLLLEQDVDIRYIQRMLGHSSISTTEIYTYVSNIKQKDILFHRHPKNFMEVEQA